MRARIENALRRGPAQVIGMVQCQECSEELLRLPGEPAVAGAAKGSLEAREAFEYLTIRGREDSSVLIGVRAQTGNSIQLVYWDRRFDGTYRLRSG